MWWFKKYPKLLIQECEGLQTNSNYKEVSQARNNLLVSSGNIIVRLSENHKYGIAIIYPHTSPFELPLVFLLKEPLSQEQAEKISRMDFTLELFEFLKPIVKFYYHRHQNPNGSLCLLEPDNLEGEGAWLFSIDQVLGRVRDWLAGLKTNHFPPEGSEVELFVHFPNRNNYFEILPTATFYDHNLEQGDFYCALMQVVAYKDVQTKIFAGLHLNGQKNGIFLPPPEFELDVSSIIDGFNSPMDFLDPEKSAIVNTKLNEGTLLKGFWWSVNKEFKPFSTIDELAEVIGNGSKEDGYKRIFQVSSESIRRAEATVFFGITFPNRRDEPEWLFLTLTKKDKSNHVALMTLTYEEFKEKLNEYEVAVVYSEKFTDDQFHLRNASRANRDELIEKVVNVIGCGSLGSEIADCLTKAGVGSIHLVDHDTLRVNNSVRHLCGLRYVGVSKVKALKEELSLSNPFIKITHAFGGIMNGRMVEMLYDDGVGISTIADDNIESYLNEQAVIHNQTIFYSRALRGGKAARIFRVIPGKDACFNCMMLHKRDKNPDFIDVPEDPNMPTITNECNNPIRPGSAADLKLISSLTSRLILDSLQGVYGESNQWVWFSEELETIKPFELKASRLKPHPECIYCRNEHPLEVTIKQGTLDFMINETKKIPQIETGGILIGSFEDTKLEILFASGPGPNAKQEPTWFEKDIPFCQKFLDDKFQEHGDKALYLGEWHYHPFRNNKPSNTDLTSLTRISYQKDYLTDKPVMIILNNEGHPRTTVHPASMRYYETEIKLN